MEISHHAVRITTLEPRGQRSKRSPTCAKSFTIKHQ